MAFNKFARAAVVHSGWGLSTWDNYLQRQKGVHRGKIRTASEPSVNLAASASDILGDTFSADKYLLTHSTIVASVDTEDVPHVKLGSINESGRNIKRKWANYHVTPQTEGWINNNSDCWDRDVLLKSYKTFVGSFNFLEHVQIEEQSKGRIIDAVARDIGPSVYIDILTATDRRHASLIRDIESGALQTLSMGCSVTETQCTKCGNVAVDETDMCPCVRYEKGNTFYDDQGVKRKVAELCGHRTLDPTGGVTFIEASWVAVPAFPGAVLRNVLSHDKINLTVQERVSEVLSSPPKEWSQEGVSLTKAASNQAGDGFLDPMAPVDSPSPTSGPGTPGGAAQSLEELKNSISQYVFQEIQKDIEGELRGALQEEAVSLPELSTSTNENINHQSSLESPREASSRYASLITHSKSDADLINTVATLHKKAGAGASQDIYRSALVVGASSHFTSSEQHLERCRTQLKRKLSSKESTLLTHLGHILSLRQKTLL